MTEPVTHSLVRTLKSVENFASFDEQQLLAAVGASANLLWPAGETVFAAGDAADAVYVVLKGRVRIHEGADGDVIAELGPGEYFGEQAVLLHTRRSATARALEDCELMVIPRVDFDDLLTADEKVGRGFRTKLEQRLAARDGQPTE